MPSDIEIARAATLKPIAAVAEKLGVPEDALHNYGKHIAKIDHGFIQSLDGKPEGKLVLVTAISPTPRARARPRRRSASRTASTASASAPSPAFASPRSAPASA